MFHISPVALNTAVAVQRRHGQQVEKGKHQVGYAEIAQHLVQIPRHRAENRLDERLCGVIGQVVQKLDDRHIGVVGGEYQRVRAQVVHAEHLHAGGGHAARGDPGEGQRHHRDHDGEAQYEHDEVHRHAGQGDLQIVPAVVAVIPGVHRHGLGPAEAHQQHQRRAQRVQVLQGVDCQPPHHPRRGVAAAVRHPGVGEFVQRKGQYAPGEGQQEEYQHPLRVAEKFVDIADQGCSLLYLLEYAIIILDFCCQRKLNKGAPVGGWHTPPGADVGN